MKGKEKYKKLLNTLIDDFGKIYDNSSTDIQKKLSSYQYNSRWYNKNYFYLSDNFMKIIDTIIENLDFEIDDVIENLEVIITKEEYEIKEWLREYSHDELMKYFGLQHDGEWHIDWYHYVEENLENFEKKLDVDEDDDLDIYFKTPLNEFLNDSDIFDLIDSCIDWCVKEGTPADSIAHEEEFLDDNFPEFNDYILFLKHESSIIRILEKFKQNDNPDLKYVIDIITKYL